MTSRNNDHAREWC